jgi:hypothetical protein
MRDVYSDTFDYIVQCINPLITPVIKGSLHVLAPGTSVFLFAKAQSEHKDRADILTLFSLAAALCVGVNRPVCSVDHERGWTRTVAFGVEK